MDARKAKDSIKLDAGVKFTDTTYFIVADLGRWRHRRSDLKIGFTQEESIYLHIHQLVDKE